MSFTCDRQAGEGGRSLRGKVLYINDIFESSKDFAFYLLTADTSLIFSNKDLQVLESTVNMELTQVGEWLKANKLTLKFKKSIFVIFLPHEKPMPFIPQIKIFSAATNTQANLQMKDC